MSISLEQFKEANNIGTLKFYKSTKSSRLVSSTMINGTEHMIMTTEQFDKAKPIFVTSVNLVDDETGEEKAVYVLTNKSAEAVMEL